MVFPANRPPGDFRDRLGEDNLGEQRQDGAVKRPEARLVGLAGQDYSFGLDLARCGYQLRLRIALVSTYFI
jgi:hypothetical protein